MFDTPILFLIFNRPDTTSKVFDTIRLVKPRILYIAADGPRSNIIGEFEKCREARSIINRIDWDCNVKTVFHESNLGCGIAVNQALDWFFEHNAEGIILEDDCLPSLDFFNYCTTLLKVFRNDTNIKMIGGSNFLAHDNLIKKPIIITSFIQIWGWASWRRAWYENDFYDVPFESNFWESLVKNYPLFRKEIVRNYWKSIFEKMIKPESKKITWDYQLQFSFWRKGGFCLLPKFNLISNIGFNEEATHTFSKLSPLANIPLQKWKYSEEEVIVIKSKLRYETQFDERIFLKTIGFDNGNFLYRRIKRIRSLCKKILKNVRLIFRKS